MLLFFSLPPWLSHQRQPIILGLGDPVNLGMGVGGGAWTEGGDPVYGKLISLSICTHATSLCGPAHTECDKLGLVPESSLNQALNSGQPV